MILLIVESPAKCKKIESFLGSGYKCVASKGHIRDLAKGDAGISIKDNFKPNYTVIPMKKSVIKNLQYLAKGAKEVIIASDLDREGEAIGYHLTQVLNLDPLTTKRIVFNQITKKAITDALKNPRTLDMDLFYAQQARRILDRLVGFRISPLLWKHIKGRLSAGRCQSVALHLVYERNHNINSFDSNSYFKISGDFSIPVEGEDEQIISTVMNIPKKEPITDLENAIQIMKGCKKSIFRVKSVKQSDSRRNPPAPFITSTLQQSASSQLSIPPDICMSLAQKLYERGMITYMRTDCTTLSPEAHSKIKDVIINCYGEELYNFREFKGKKTANAQEAHEAIRPVYVDKTLDDYPELEGSEARLYDLIRKRTLASQMGPQEKKIFTVSITWSKAPDKTVKYHFITKLEREDKQGYMVLYRLPETENNMITNKLCDILKPKKVVKRKLITGEQRVTKPVGRFTESSLIKELEKRGIGRPSTFSSLISKIKERNYVVKDTRQGEPRKAITLTLQDDTLKSVEREVPGEMERNKLFLTSMGKIVDEFLQEHFKTIFNYDFTSKIENELDSIAGGKRVWNEVVSEVFDKFNPDVLRLMDVETENSHMKKYQRLLGTDPETEEEVYAIHSRYGPAVRRGGGIIGDVIVKSEFASIIGDITPEDITLEQALELLSFPKCLGVYKDNEIVINSGRYGHYLKFKGKNYSIPKETSPFTLTIEDAQGIIDERDKLIIKEFKGFSIRNGPYGPYIFKNGKFISIPKDIEPKDLTHKQCLEIIKKRGSNRVQRGKRYRKYIKK